MSYQSQEQTSEKNTATLKLSNRVKIIFAGGGTLGPVTPLLAAARVIKRELPEAEFIWYGTPNGPERAAVEAESLPFRAIHVAKLPRYPSRRWLSFPFDYARAQKESRTFLKQDRPDLIVSAGGFTAVPVIKIGHRMGIPCAIHQLDKLPGLSNENVARFCKSVTTSFSYTASPFGKIKTKTIATPSRFSLSDLPSHERAAKFFELNPNKPIVLVMGGGTGAQALNEALWDRLDDWLAKTQVIHIAGKGKGSERVSPGYVQKEFLDANGMLHAYAAADLVVSRAGMGSISELAALKKPTIFIPIPHNQQEINAEALERDQACLVVSQPERDFAARLYDATMRLLSNRHGRHAFGERLHEVFPTDDGSALAHELLRLIKKNAPT